MWKRFGLASLLIILWAILLIVGTLFGWWRTTLAPLNDPRAFAPAAIAMINHGNRGNTAFVLIEKGAHQR